MPGPRTGRGCRQSQPVVEPPVTRTRSRPSHPRLEALAAWPRRAAGLGAPLPFAVDPCLHTWLDPQNVERSVTDAPGLAVVVRARPLIPEPAGATERIEPVGSYHACTARP